MSITTNGEILTQTDDYFTNLVEREYGPLDELVMSSFKDGKIIESDRLEQAGGLIAEYLGMDDDVEPHVDLVLYVRNADCETTWLSYVSDSRDA